MADTTLKTQETAPEWVEVGVLQRGHGIRGDVIIKPHNPATGVFVKGLAIRLVPKNDSPESSRVTYHRVLSVYAKAGKGGLKITLDGIRDRTHADSLRGAKIMVTEEDVPGLEEGEFFHADLVGLDVTAVDLDGAPVIGTLSSVMESPAHDIFVVELSAALQSHLDEDTGEIKGRELLIPCVERFVESVDVPGKAIKVRQVLELAAGLDPKKGAASEADDVDGGEFDEAAP